MRAVPSTRVDGGHPPASAAALASRLASLDVFRGATMAAMVIVNNPGDWSHVYAPLRHAEWHGWTPTDLIFPFFLSIVGVSLTLSRRTGQLPAIVRRAASIFAIGLGLNFLSSLGAASLRIPGVLQRIAICYLVAAVIFQLAGGLGRARRTAYLSAGIAAVLLVGYWLLMTLTPGPGGVGDLSPEGNLAARVDRLLLEGHLWRPRWDPEGLLSTLPAIATTLCGVLAGIWLRSGRPRATVAAGLLAGGLAGIAIGLAWDTVFPINKNLWTSSFAIFTAGAGATAFGLCYAIVDLKGWRWWTRPFLILGANALALYVMSGLLARALGITVGSRPDGRPLSAGGWIFDLAFRPIAPPEVASLLYAVVHLVLLFLVLRAMYQRGIIWRV